MKRYVYMFLIALAVIILLVFKIQNLSAVTVSFPGADFTMPVSFLILGVYALGMLTVVFLQTKRPIPDVLMDAAMERDDGRRRRSGWATR